MLPLYSADPTDEQGVTYQLLEALNKAKQQLQQSGPPPRDPPPKPPTSARPRFYRPNTSHHYLTATDVNDCSYIESTHGRPTRTTLLRAHQRVSSAPPVNAYEERRIQRQSEEERAVKRPISSAGSVTDSVHQEMVAKKVDLEGDTVHQFLIGARYNSAHYVDKKAIEKYGVYMSRHHPGQLFTKNDNGKPPSPRSRPSSPVEAWNSSSHSGSHSAAPSPPPPSTPTGIADAVPESEELTTTSSSSPPLTVRGSRISAGPMPTASASGSGPAPTPRDSVSVAPRRPATPSFGGMPARRVKSAGERRLATPLPQVVGLSLQIGPGIDAASPAASARPPVPRTEAVIRARRILASSRLGNRFAPPASRRAGLPASEVNRAFCVRPWRDPKTLRTLIRQSAAQKAEAGKKTEAEAKTQSRQRREEEEEEAARMENPITIQVEVRSTESGQSSAGPGVVLEDLEAEGRKAAEP